MIHLFFGILCRKGKVYAEIVPGVEVKDLQSLIEKQVKKGSTISDGGWRGYTGLAAKGYVHRLADHSKNEYSDKKGNHINGLEGFWGHLKRKMSAKGGIRKEKLSFYLGEYVWRYNQLSLTFKKQEKRLLNLWRNSSKYHSFRRKMKLKIDITSVISLPIVNVFGPKN